MQQLNNTQVTDQIPEFKVKRELAFQVAAGMVIDAQNVTKIYGSGPSQVFAADHVSFQVRQGEFVGLVGPSGSGKTTMLAVLAALLRPSEGKVLIDGFDLGSMKEDDRVKFRHERIGFTFQANNLLPYLTVQENVELMLRLNNRLNKAEREHAALLLERLGLTRPDEKPSQPAFRRAASASRHCPFIDPQPKRGLGRRTDCQPRHRASLSGHPTLRRPDP